MSETFEKILTKDDRIACITSKVKFQVVKGGQNITCQPFKAVSSTPTAHVFNVTVPSLETIISREVLWKSTVTLMITGANKPATEFLVNYGVTDALAPFPLHSLVSTMTTTINNDTVSMNVQDTLPVLLRLVDAEELAKYNDMTPTALDHLAHYSDGIDAMDWQIDRVVDAPNNHSFPGVFNVAAGEADPTIAGQVGTRPRSFVSYPNNVLGFDMNRAIAQTETPKHRGSWKLKELYALNGAGAKINPRVADNVVYATFEVTEPLLLSPFVFGSGMGKQGFYGIQTMNFQMNMAPSANRAWRSAIQGWEAGNYRKNVTVLEFTDSQLLFQFLTPHPSDLLEPRNVVPYYELPIYRTTSLPLLPHRPHLGQMQAGVFVEPVSTTLYSSNIQLSGIPDKLIIFARRTITNMQNIDADSYATISNISINFNNQAGLLSSMTPQQLYRNSVQSGLVGLSWDQFSGSVVSVAGYLDAANGRSSTLRSAYAGLGANLAGGNNPGFQLVPTTGTILVLNFAEVIQLTEEYYAPGSLGSFNLQLAVVAQNNTNVDWAAGSYELVVMPMNCGVFVNEKGTSSTFLSLLTKQDVLDSLNQEPYSHSEVHRMVGGSFLDNIRSSLGWISSKLPSVKHVLNHIPHAYAQTGAKVLDALGYAKPQNTLQNRLA